MKEGDRAGKGGQQASRLGEEGEGKAGGGGRMHAPPAPSMLNMCPPVGCFLMILMAYRERWQREDRG